MPGTPHPTRGPLPASQAQDRIALFAGLAANRQPVTTYTQSPRRFLMPRYNPNEIEPRWQQYWDENHTFATPEMPEGEKLYVLDMFPYPSGSGLHVGHPEGYTATDITCRFERMRGRSVLHPMGFDSFGLPAEEHAIKTNTHPRIQTEKNIGTFRGQLKRLGFSYDWNRELATTDTDYFRWTQWIFLELFDTWFDVEQQKGRPIAELAHSGCRTGRGRRGCAPLPGRPPARLPIVRAGELVPHLGHRARQRRSHRWSQRSGRPPRRAFAAAAMDASHYRLRRPVGSRSRDARLARAREGLAAQLDRPQHRRGGRFLSLAMARATRPRRPPSKRGRRPAVPSGFPEKPGGDVLRVYTTRPDTLFGATYMVIAPEHALVERLTTEAQAQAVDNYCRKAAGKSDLERTELAKEKTRRVHWQLRTQPRKRRTGAHLDCRLCARHLRHRRHHGRTGAR